MTKAIVNRSLLTLAATVLLTAPAFGQNRQERTRLLDPATEVSGDLRRIPVPPGPKGSEGVLVLHIERSFEGTGVVR